MPRAHGLEPFCPRCGMPTVHSVVHGKACISRKCSWPNPEPGVINSLRYKLGGRADSVLQTAREKGLWPPKPRL